MQTESPRASPLLTRVLSVVVLAVMAAATAYALWIALSNMDRIGV